MRNQSLYKVYSAILIARLAIVTLPLKPVYASALTVTTNAMIESAVMS
ncbi:MAG: hypothetical protein ACK40V_04535 [Anaerolineales bacterium]